MSNKKSFAKKRKIVIEEILRMSEAQHKGDQQLLVGIKELCNHLGKEREDKIAKETVDGLLGFIKWCKQQQKPEGLVLTNLIHDLGEYRRHKNEA